MYVDYGNLYIFLLLGHINASLQKFFELVSVPILLNSPTWDAQQICFPKVTTAMPPIPYVLLQGDLPFLQPKVEFNFLTTLKLSGLCEYIKEI